MVFILKSIDYQFIDFIVRTIEYNMDHVAKELIQFNKVSTINRLFISLFKFIVLEL